MDDYVTVMPLTWKRRFGISYLRQPWFTQQLGIFSTGLVQSNDVTLFMNSIPQRFRYIDIQLNTTNALVSESFNINLRNNFVLDLSPSYIQLQSNYHRNCRRNIQKAIHQGLYVKSGPGPSVFTGYIKKNLDPSLRKNKGLFEIMPGIIQATLERSCGTVLGVYDRREELNAAGWFVNISGRCLFMVCASTAQGKKKQAMYLLVDHMIREKAGNMVAFDFTGSSMPGIAYFNTGFGAEQQIYQAVKKNRLPWMMRMFKK